MGGRMSSVFTGRMQTRWVAGLVHFLQIELKYGLPCATWEPVKKSELYGSLYLWEAL